MEQEIKKFHLLLEQIILTLRSDVEYIWNNQKIPDSFRKHLEIVILNLRIQILTRAKEIFEKGSFYPSELGIPLNQAVARANQITTEIHITSQNDLGVLLPFPGNQKPIVWRS